MFSPVAVAGVVAYLCPAVARTYDDGRVSGIIKTGALVLGMPLIVLAYRSCYFTQSSG
jgi:hypothetical protein